MSDTTNGQTESRKKFQRMKQTYDGGVVTTIFADTKLTRTCDILSNMPAELSSKLLAEFPALVDAASYGLLQKEKDSNSEWPGSDADAASNMDEVDADFLAGRFGGRSGSGDVVQAMAAVTGVPLEKAQAIWMTYDDDRRDSTRKHPKIKAHVDALRAQRTAARAAADTTEFKL